uniref:DNA primase large subunit n=1 Tax=Meloidogyne incognita TaxID=6306 RepID=A0A914MUI6_MELIC
MEFGSRSVIRRINKKQDTSNVLQDSSNIQHVTIVVDETDNYNLSFYNQPPSEVITVEEFQKLGMERMNVLRELESLKEKYAADPRKYLEQFIEEVGRLEPFFTNGLLSSQLREARRKDRISHFILRLAFCQSQEMSQWFVKQETELFRMRFQLEAPSKMLQFLKANNINPQEVDENEKKGLAYISSNELISFVAPQFKENINSSLDNARKKVGAILMQQRLVPLLRHIVGAGTSKHGNRDQSSGSFVAPEDLDALAIESFPLCMQEIHSHLRKEHHLRYNARNQYGLFLKGIGLSLEGALEFFRSEFTKRMESDQFNKQYRYNIRHMYGMEGNRIDKKPLSCSSIILGAAPNGIDCHGCPFRHMESELLTKKLNNIGLNEDQVAEIMYSSKCHRYDKACTKYFEFVHKIPDLEELITHPNQYYSLSRKARRGELIIKSEEIVDEEIPEMNYNLEEMEMCEDE